MESRAAVFTSSPQDVEVYSAGEWLPGSLLGWRHDATGGCQVWVRLAVGGADEQQWTDLECLRLPERHLAVAAPAVAVPMDDVAATRSLRLADVSATGSARRGRPAVAASSRRDLELTATRGFPAVRDEVASRASHPAGRRRADSRVVGETAEFSVVDAAGRHRAPASPAPSAGSGRHRAADTGVWPALVEADLAPARTPEERAAQAWGTRTDDTWPGMPAQPDLLTRPMRLDGPGLSGSGRGSAPQPRAARRDDSLSGV
jgi:hypothetical protein